MKYSLIWADGNPQICMMHPCLSSSTHCSYIPSSIPTLLYLRKLSARSNNNWGLGGATLRSVGLNRLDDVHALDDGPKHNVLPIKPGGHGGTEEELVVEQKQIH